MVIAASFSQTYLRNAFNNAFICLEGPDLYEAIRRANKTEACTVPTDPVAVDFEAGRAIWRGQSYTLSALGPAAQELVLAGGLEALTRQKLGL